MTSDLLLEATPKLLDGWCGPVVVDWGEPGPFGQAQIEAGIVRPGPDGPQLWTDTVQDWMPVDDDAPAIFLDLARAECRARVARVATRVYGHTLILDGHVVVINWGKGSREWFAHHDLNPADDTRLPDGSRLVDAQGLLVVAT